MNNLKKMWAILSLRNRQSTFVLVIFMLVGMILETFSVGLVIPLIAIFTQEDLIVQYPSLIPLINFLGNPEKEVLLVYAMFFLLGVYFVKNMFLALLAWRQMDYVYEVRTYLAKKLFSTYLLQPYKFHIQHNSSQLIRNITNEISVFIGYGVLPIIKIVSEGFVLVGILALLILVEPYGTLILILTISASTFGFQLLIRNRVSQWGKDRQFHDGMIIKYIQQGLGGAKEVKMLGCEKTFLSLHDESHKRTAKLLQYQQTLEAIPKLWLEVIVMLSVLILVIIMVLRGDDILSLITVLGLFIAAAFRLLPSVSRIVSSYNSFHFSLSAIDLLDKEMKLKVNNTISKNQIDPKLLKFRDKIHLSDIFFKYSGSLKPAINKVMLNISFRESIGFIGSSGAGKSTIIDIILGLLTPESGQVFVDGVDIQEDLRGWQNQIGYVPQSVFLTDDTLRRNVAFGLDDSEIDEKAVWSAIKASQLEDFVTAQPDGLETIIGERGVRISGGQRQRIGIARALYNDPEVIVLDEATSSLDNFTESEIMETINTLHGNKTLIIVAHRLSTVKNCDCIYRLEDGLIIEEGPPSEILRKK